MSASRHLTTILIMTDTQPLAEVKTHFSTYVDRVSSQQDRVTITRNGRPAAVLISTDELESLEETIELLSDPAAMAQLAEAQAELDRGLGVPLDEVRQARQP